ncbi:MAG: hypothetical protein KatS3mg105_0875 [Gemmatales bacterium]|nr:MAG: hypothetical protein KatS3mg105_0875 [Gemmatales bacterium]
MNVRFLCPSCEQPTSTRIEQKQVWQCPNCDYRMEWLSSPAEPFLSKCLVCGNQELYKKKNFPHWLGLGILALASLVFFIGHGYYHPKVAWAVLIGSAVFDGLLYLWVGDVVVCYRCHAHYRGLLSSAAYQPFDLGISERYRQQRLMQEQLKHEQQHNR